MKDVSDARLRAAERLISVIIPKLFWVIDRNGSLEASEEAEIRELITAYNRVKAEQKDSVHGSGDPAATACDSEVKTFPVLWQHDREEEDRMRQLRCPTAVPWEFVAEHREQCLKNHEQTPERLAERGGLAPSEIVAVVEDRAWHNMSIDDQVNQLNDLVKAWNTISLTFDRELDADLELVDVDTGWSGTRDGYTLPLQAPLWLRYAPEHAASIAAWFRALADAIERGP